MSARHVHRLWVFETGNARAKKMAVFWKELVVASGVLPSDGWQEFTLQPSSAQGSTSTTQIGGGVPFRDSGSTNPVTRNRFLVWYVRTPSDKSGQK